MTVPGGGPAGSAAAGRGGMGALAAFELRRRLFDPGVAAGVLLFLLLTGLEAWGRGTGVLAGDGGGTAFGLAWVAGAALGLRTGHGTDRAAGFTAYLTLNFLSPGRVAAARTAAAVVYLAAFGVVAAAAAALMGGADPGMAAWRSCTLTLAALVFLPVLAGVELVSATRFPALVVLLLYVVGGVVWVGLADDPEGYLGALGLDALEPGSWGGLGPLALRAALGPPLAALVAGWVEGRRRGPGLASGLSDP